MGKTQGCGFGGMCARGQDAAVSELDTRTLKASSDVDSFSTSKSSFTAASKCWLQNQHKLGVTCSCGSKLAVATLLPVWQGLLGCSLRRGPQGDKKNVGIKPHTTQKELAQGVSRRSFSLPVH